MTPSRFHIALLASTALIALAGPGQANPLAYSNDNGGSATGYGQLSPTYLGFDDGQETYGNAADNANSNSRVGLYLDQDFGSGYTFRFRFETALGAPQSSAFSQTNEPIWEWSKTNLRHLELIYGGPWGKFLVGQGNMATDGTTSQDLSRTGIAGSRAIADTAGGYAFRETDGDLSSVTIGGAFLKYDGTRRMRIRYDTPKFGGQSGDTGLNFAAAYGYDALNDDNTSTYRDIAAYYNETYSSLQVIAAAGYRWVENNDETTQNWSASASALHMESGVNGTVATGGNPDGGSFVYVKAGWIADWLETGNTALGLDYYSGKDTIYDGAEPSKWGLQIVQYFDDVNLEAYVAYNGYGFDDDTGANYDDSASTLAGLRWKF